MKKVYKRVCRSILSCVVPLIIVSLVASCTFGLTPAKLNRSSATVSIAFPQSPLSAPKTGDSRAVASGANWLYLRAGDGDGSFDIYGPYKVGSGTFTTKDIPAGAYEYLSILLVSESIPAKTELTVGGATMTFAGALSLPDDQFFALISDGSLASFFDGRWCVASGYVIRQCKISSGKENVISATLVPLTTRAATVKADPSSAFFACPLNDSGSLRPVYFKVGALTYPEGTTPAVKVTIAPTVSATSGASAGWSRVGSVILYGETGAYLGTLDVNAMLTFDKEKPDNSVRSFTVENPTRGALYAYASYENALDISLVPVTVATTPPVDEVGTYVSATGTAGAAGTRADPQNFAWAINKDESPTILLLGDVEINTNLTVTRTLKIKSAAGVTAPRIKAASGFYNTFLTVTPGGNLTLQGVCLEGSPEAHGPALYIAGGSATLTGGAVITGSMNDTAPGGGAAYVASGSLTLYGATIENCSSVRGGGVYVANTGTLVMQGSGMIRMCVASEFGGGVYAENGATVDISAALPSTITSNSAVRGGGGVFLYDGATFTEGSGWASRISGNDAAYALPNLARRVLVTTVEELNTALNNTSVPSHIELTGPITISSGHGVTAECSLYSSSPLTISRGLSSVPLFVVQSGAKFSIGGSVRIDGLGLGLANVIMPLVKVTGGSFALRDSASLVYNYNAWNNPSDRTNYGGAVNVSGGGVFTMYGGKLGDMETDYNTSNRGGHVYVCGGSFVFRGGMIMYGHATYKDGDSSSGCGGGVYVDGTTASAATFEMPADSTGLFISNGAEVSGGGLALNGSKASAFLKGGNIGDVSTGNTANSLDGGGLYLTGGAKATLSGTKIMRNNATIGNGGGVYVSTGSTLTIEPSVTEALITFNDAPNGDGGGLYLETIGCCNADVSLLELVTDNNTASGSPEYYRP